MNGGDIINNCQQLHLYYLIKLIVLIICSTLLSLFLQRVGIGKESIIMVFLVSVLITTVITKGYLYGITASIISVFIFNYFFTIPVHTFITYNPNDVILMVAFLGASLILGTMTNMFQKQLLIAKQNEHTARLLYKVTNSFLNITGKENIILQGINYIYQNTKYNSKVSLLEFGEIYIDKKIGFKTEDMSIMEITIQGLTKKLGIIQVAYCKDNFSLEHDLLIKTVITQMGLSLDRELIYNEREKIRIAMEREKTRSNLLRAISHDLRTPLTGIVGASGVIIDNLDSLDKLTINKLASNINDEALWLNKLVENILNMTRIDDGKFRVNKKYEVIDDIVHEAMEHVSRISNKRIISVSIPDEIITIFIDGKLIVQVLINLLDNAINHTQDHCSIYLRVHTQGNTVIFDIADNGDGIDKNIEDTLFESFVTFSNKVIDGNRGIGIGLSICKSIIEAHDGTITVSRATEGGALFTFTLPIMEV
ncbi:sensor histidine kinase [Alkalibaculum sporogenes]|uniref:sensor histidine kinase n=1 Tax=Alkalibaculum sporogenes TaxID=2655001 RepID=UPI0031B632EE